MRKLTPIQQEVIDLIKEGWELGSDLTINGSSWLQYKGLGKGGKSKKVSSATIHTLEYLGYIERASSKFPTLHWKLKEDKPTTKEVLVKSDPLHGDKYNHPSYGTLSFNQTQGGDSVLFGSSIKHNNVVILRISHAEKHLSNAQEYVFSRGTIVEAYLSATQFADAIMGKGSGGEVPITLQFTEKAGRIDNPAFVSKREQFETEFKERAQGIIDRMAETIGKAKDKGVPRWLVHDMEINKGWLISNIPFLAEQFSEQMDRTVTEAKGEIEAHVSNLIRQTGLDALEDMKPLLPDSKDSLELPEGQPSSEGEET